MSAEIDSYKQLAGRAAADVVESGMLVGLGSGSTAAFAVAAIAERLRAGAIKGIHGIPTSDQTEAQAIELGIPLADLNDYSGIDLSIDGADEVDPALNLIKGGGGALLREKIVAQASRRNIIVVDPGKLSPTLGTNFALPIEVAPFGWRMLLDFVTGLGARVALRYRGDDEPYLTDQGNYVLDANFGPIADPHALSRALEGRPGVLEHGLFLGLATDLIVGGPDGVEHRGPAA